MKIAYHYPAANTIYAQRTIHNGFMHAFEDLGHQFCTFTPPARLSEFLDESQPDIFITASHFFYRKQLDYRLLQRYREAGMVMLTKVDFWSPLRTIRVNEARGLKEDRGALRLIGDGLLGDRFFHVVEQGDSRMDGFETHTGQAYATVPLAADKTMLPVRGDDAFASDVAYVGTWLPAKRGFFEEALYPLRSECELKVYGQDWTRRERLLGFCQKVGQYFNMPGLRSLQRPKLTFEQEFAIYRTARVAVNIHEEDQRRAGGDCNERTFKIPLAGGFEITDDVACIRKYFDVGTELVIATDPSDWMEKVLHYVRRPEERQQIIEAGHARVLRDHTYHNRAAQLLRLAGKDDAPSSATNSPLLEGQPPGSYT